MVQQVIGLLFGIILGRLLAPSDYGMMAIISVFSLVAVALQDSVFKVALANEKAPTHADYNAVFWFNILMGIALYAALFLSAPPLIGRWYNTPQVVPLCRYAFLSIVVASMGTAQSAWLFKNPTVAVVMCTYNGEKYLREQMDSILAQTYPIHEIIVQDDRSTDGTVALLRQYAARGRRCACTSTGATWASTATSTRRASAPRPTSWPYPTRMTFGSPTR